MGTQKCSSCREVKPVAHFNVNRRSRRGIQNNCRPCNAATSKLHRMSSPATLGTSGAVSRSRLSKRQLFNGMSSLRVTAEVNFDYALAKLLTQKTGEAHHVDHIKPIIAGGVHRLYNLAVITATRNLQKGGAWFNVDDEYDDEHFDRQDREAIEFTPVVYTPPEQLSFDF